MTEYKKPEIRTNSIVFFDSRNVMLKLSFYNENISLVLTPGMEVNGRMTYPKENGKSVLITKERVEALHTGIMHTLLEKYEAGEPYSIGVFLTKDRTSTIEFATEPSGVTSSVKLILTTGIQLDGTASIKHVFNFEKTPYIENYNSETGQYSLKELDANFMIFVKALDTFLLNVSGMVSHSDRYYNNYSSKRILEYLDTISAKLGCVPPPSFTPTGNTFMQQKPVENPVAFNEISDVSDLSELI